MKKFLSLVLVLSMIISCVSMVSFIVNAEEATASNESNSSGMEFSVVSTPVSEGFPVWHGNAGLTQSDADANKNIILSFDVYNIGDTNTKFAIFAQHTNWYTNTAKLPQSGSKEIAKDQMIRVTLTIPIDGEGNAVGTSGSTALSDVYIRLQMESGFVNTGTKLLVVGNNDLSVSVIQKATNISAQSGAATTDFSCNTWTGERPTMGMEFSVVTAPSKGYPVWHGNAGLTQSDADTNNNIILSFDVYNIGETATKFNLSIRNNNGYADYLPSSTKEIAKGQMIRVTMSISINADTGLTTGGYTLAKLMVRLEMMSGFVNEGTKLLVVGNDALSVSVIQKATNISAQSGAATTDFSCNTWTGERPTMGMEFSVVTALSAGYPVWSGNAGLTNADVANSKIALSFDVYNVGETATKFNLSIRNKDGYANYLPSSGTKEIAKGQMIRVTMSITIDAATDKTKGGYTLENLIVRLEMMSGFVNEGTKLLVVGNDDLSVSVIQKLANVNVSARDGATETDFSHKSWTGERPALIKGANLEIGSTLTVNYFATLAEGCENAVMVFTRNGKTDRVQGVVQADGTFMFAYTGINPQCMGDNIYAELVLGDEVLDIYEEYSIKQYALNQYNDKATDEKAIALNTLLADMLAYGAASQTYTGYKDDQLVNADIDWPTSPFEAPKSDRSIVKNDEQDARVTSVGLNISNVYKIYFKLNITAKNVVVELNDKEVTVNGDIIYTDDIMATEHDKTYTLKIFKDDDSVSEVTYSVNSYINAMWNNKDIEQDERDIIQAISNYGNAAKKYDELSTNP